MPVYVISKIVPKNDAFTGVVDAKQIDGGTNNKAPDDAISESSVTQHSDALATSITGVSDIEANTTHRTSSTGADHSYIDQDVSSTAIPTFAAIGHAAQGSDPPIEEGRIWRDAVGNLSYHSGAGRLDLNTDKWAVCDNETLSQIDAGTPVMVVGASPNFRRSIQLADNTTLDNISRYFGLAMENIPASGTGKVAFKDGIVYSVNTSSWPNGARLFLSSTPGVLTDVPPSSPEYVLTVAGVIFQHATGGIIGVQEGRGPIQDPDVKTSTSTGLVYGGELSINGDDDSTFDIAAGKAFVVDSYTDPTNPVLTSVVWDTQIGVSIPNIGSQPITRVAVDINGNFPQYDNPSTAELHRDEASLGALVHANLANITSVSDGFKAVNFDTALRDLDMYEAIGRFVKISGLSLSANGPNQRFNRESGSMFAPGTNYSANKKSPNIVPVNSEDAPFFLRGKGDGVIPAAPVQDIPSDQYDPDGLGTLVDIPVGFFTAHRIYFDASSGLTFFLYGQHIYDSISKAVGSFESEAVIEPVPFNVAYSLGVAIVCSGSTDLSDRTCAAFATFGTFGSRTLTSVDHIDRFASATGLVDGQSYDQHEIELVLDTGVIYADVERVDVGGDMIYIFNQQEYILDCTDGAGVDGKARVALTAGASSSIGQENFVYVVVSGEEAILTASTARPTGEYAMVAHLSIPDITTFSTEGPYAFQRWTEAIVHHERGAIAHLKENLRNRGAVYDEGVDPVASIDTGPSPDEIDFQVSSGKVFQLHRQDFPALQVSVDGIYVANASGEDTLEKFDKIFDLATVQEDVAGGSLSNKYYNLVIWGAVNKTTGDCKLFVNLPAEAYNSGDSAYFDVNSTAIVGVPREFRGVAFLIARIPLKFNAGFTGSTFINPVGYPEIIDLRGNPVGVSGSGASGAATSFSDAIVNIFNNADSSKILDFDVSPVTTATTRTITMADADVDLADVALNNTHRIDSNTFKASRQTLDGATYNDLGSVSLAADAYYCFEGIVIAKEVGTTDMRSWKFYAVADRNGVVSGASYTEISVVDSGGASTPANWTLSSTVVSDSWRLEVTGEATTTINWDTRFHYVENAD